jgi:hypothetical protein
MKKALPILAVLVSLGLTALHAAIPPVRINCGGSALKGWDADRGCTNGTVASTLSTIKNVHYAPAALYQSCRTGRSLAYDLPDVPDGRYLVRLHFADLVSTAISQRRFNIQLEGVTALTDLDVYARAGGQKSALMLSFSVTVSGGDGLQILAISSSRFVTAFISGIEVIAPAAEGMSLVPAGSNVGINPLAKGELPTAWYPRAYALTNGTPFYMDRTEVTKAKWDEVRAWGLTNGFTDLPEGLAQGPDHPVHDVSWYDCVKWCNARSKMEGLTPAYNSSLLKPRIYKTGQLDLDDRYVNRQAGYRLPTQQEWEFAARGGLTSRRFPWGNSISHAQANYMSISNLSFDVSLTRGYHPLYIAALWPYTSPAGSFSAHGYGAGLYDMAGNLDEWCWDGKPGGDEGMKSAVKSGLCMDTARHCRVGANWFYHRIYGYYGVGVRTLLPAQP